ncbi:MAG TPA: PilZ domain-containing protein [Polyangiales bacterium]|nr:PilZ domain-containing protein [Polyangiales bacterium]
MSAMLWERRKFFRIPISGKALLQHGEKVDGLYSLENLSIGGCMLSHGPDCALGDCVELTLHVDGESEIELPAKVVRHEQQGNGTTIGLCFTDTDPMFEDRIQDLVMRSIERDQQSEILVVHAHPERVDPLLETIKEVGQSVVAARTPRDALAILESGADRIHMAIIAPVVGTSTARDIVKLILRRFPHVHCVMLSRGGAERLTRAIKSASPEDVSPWSLSRLRRVISKHEVIMVASA